MNRRAEEKSHNHLTKAIREFRHTVTEMDVLTPEQRSRCMAAVRGRDTGPELVVRRALSAMGYRYRLHRRDLPGNPDIVFVSRKAVVFVHGCFWHRHACRFGRAMPATRAAFWKAKFDGNVARDKRAKAKLRRLGWRVLVVWECKVRDVEGLARVGVRLRRFLGPIKVPPSAGRRKGSAVGGRGKPGGRKRS